MSDWEGFLTENPKVLWGLVADVVKAVKANEGERKTGRRPAASCASLEELYEVLFPPAYTTRPFAVTLLVLLAEKGISQKELAARVFVNQATISRLISGAIPLTTDLLESIATALDVRPHYFAEYRSMKLGETVAAIFAADPDLSADVVRRMFMAGAPA